MKLALSCGCCNRNCIRTHLPRDADEVDYCVDFEGGVVIQNPMAGTTFEYTTYEISGYLNPGTFDYRLRATPVTRTFTRPGRDIVLDLTDEQLALNFGELEEPPHCVRTRDIVQSEVTDEPVRHEIPDFGDTTLGQQSIDLQYNQEETVEVDVYRASSGNGQFASTPHRRTHVTIEWRDTLPQPVGSVMATDLADALPSPALHDQAFLNAGQDQFTGLVGTQFVWLDDETSVRIVDGVRHSESTPVNAELRFDNGIVEVNLDANAFGTGTATGGRMRTVSIDNQDPLPGIVSSGQTTLVADVGTRAWWESLDWKLDTPTIGVLFLEAVRLGDVLDAAGITRPATGDFFRCRVTVLETNRWSDWPGGVGSSGVGTPPGFVGRAVYEARFDVGFEYVPSSEFDEVIGIPRNTYRVGGDIALTTDPDSLPSEPEEPVDLHFAESQEFPLPAFELEDTESAPIPESDVQVNVTAAIEECQ